MRRPKKEIYDLIVELSKIDYNEPLPEVTEPMVIVWGDHYRTIMDIIPPEAKPTRVLEIGVGYGILALLVKRAYNCTVVATEHASRGYLQSVPFRALMEREGVTIVEHELSDPLPFEEGAFDMVFYCDVMEHLPPEVLRISLREIRRVTKKEGYLILSTPNLARLPNRIRLLSGKGINPPLNPRMVGETYDHIREFTTDEVAALLGDGFRILRREYSLIPFFNSRFNRLNSLLFPFFKSFGDELYLVAEAVGD